MVTTANALFYLTCLPSRLAYALALRHPQAVQCRYLAGVLQANRDTEFARAHDFRSLEAFRGSVPIRDYEEFAPWLQRVAAGVPGVLTAERVRLLEPTGGTSSATKLIPYTRGLQRDFQRALGPWLGSLLEGDPGLFPLRSYWSVTPLVERPSHSSGGIPIGFEEDTAYLPPLARRLVESVQAVPPSVKRLRDTEAFLKATADHLARCPDLGLISVWSPTFLELLLDRVGDNPWPRLRWLSCWGDASAAPQLARLRPRLPGVRVQTKGLLATEGVVTIPYGGRHRLAVRSHFFEILTDRGEALCAWEWEPGLEGSILLTTAGGLYRYRLEDRVRVTGPLALQFLGKEGLVSDRHGEKLAEPFVRACLAGVAGFLAYEPGGYVLFCDRSDVDVEGRLRASFHYDYCRRLGQLQPLRVVLVADVWPRYLEGCRQLGQRLGDVKPTCLDLRDGWVQRMA